MSVRQGNRIIAGQLASGVNLFDFKWADHQLDDMSWLRADTFSWHSGDVYVAAYEHLVADYENTESETLYAWDNGVGYYVYTLSESPSAGDSVYDSSGVLDSSESIIDVAGGGIYVGEDEVSSLLYTRDSSRDTKIPQTDTIDGITITYFLAQDGHKICTPDQESKIVALYEATGVAWYYILDTDNKQFKLPRTKWGFVGLRGSLAAYIAAGAPNIMGTAANVRFDSVYSASGCFYTTNDNAGSSSGGGRDANLNFDASRSSSVYGNSDTIQPPATQMYLYFYVGNFERLAEKQTAGLNAEMFNELNAHKVTEFQAPTSANGYTWYRKYADGWVEQGGWFLGTANGAAKTIALPIEMIDTNYSGYGIVSCNNAGDSGNATSFRTTFISTSTTQITLSQTNGWRTNWQVCGMAA